MPRIKRGVKKNKKRKKLLSQTKGFRHGRKSKYKQARQAIFKAGAHAFTHRKDHKGNMRRAWINAINYAVRPLGLSYSRFINALSSKEVALNRKVLAEIAHDHPETFKRIVEEVK